MQATRRWYRQTGSPTGAFGLVVERFIPVELAHKIQQAFLPAAGDEFLQREGHRCLLGALAADFQGAFDQIGIKGEGW